MGYMKDFDRRIRQGGDDAIEALGEYVAMVEPRTWISVSQDLPERGEEVLATDGKRCGVLSFVDGYIDAVPLQEWEGPLIPTHWMPLPEPPSQ